jgi:hypothetical protein
MIVPWVCHWKDHTPIEYNDPDQGFVIFPHFHVFSLSDLCCLGGGLPRPEIVRAHARMQVHMILRLCSTDIMMSHVSKFLRMIADIGSNSCLFRPAWQADPGRGPARHEAVRLRSTARHITPNGYKPANGNQAHLIIICGRLLSLASMQAGFLPRTMVWSASVSVWVMAVTLQNNDDVGDQTYELRFPPFRFKSRFCLQIVLFRACVFCSIIFWHDSSITMCLRPTASKNFNILQTHWTEGYGLGIQQQNINTNQINRK